VGRAAVLALPRGGSGGTAERRALGFPADAACAPQPSLPGETPPDREPSPADGAGPAGATPTAATAKPVGERLAALASSPMTWFGVAVVLVGLALLIAVLAANRARRWRN
jgi:hypothetical protein